MNTNHHVSYLEFPAANLQATKTFFEEVFDWQFEDFGPDYTAFSNAGVDGGFFRSELTSSSSNGSALVVLYCEDLTALTRRIVAAGGTIVTPLFEFPGGWRFHFSEPSGNELAAWSDIRPLLA